MLLVLARAGQGIAYLPGYLVQDHLSAGDLQPLLTNHLLDALPISIVYPSRPLLGKAKRLLIEHLMRYSELRPL